MHGFNNSTYRNSKIKYAKVLHGNIINPIIIKNAVRIYPNNQYTSMFLLSKIYLESNRQKAYIASYLGLDYWINLGCEFADLESIKYLTFPQNELSIKHLSSKENMIKMLSIDDFEVYKRINTDVNDNTDIDSGDINSVDSSNKDIDNENTRIKEPIYNTLTSSCDEIYNMLYIKWNTQAYNCPYFALPHECFYTYKDGNLVFNISDKKIIKA